MLSFFLFPAPPPLRRGPKTHYLPKMARVCVPIRGAANQSSPASPELVSSETVWGGGGGGGAGGDRSGCGLWARNADSSAAALSPLEEHRKSSPSSRWQRFGELAEESCSYLTCPASSVALSRGRAALGMQPGSLDTELPLSAKTANCLTATLSGRDKMPTLGLFLSSPCLPSPPSLWPYRCG